MARRRRGLLVIVAALLALALVAVLAHRPLLRSAGSWLLVEDRLEPADAIVVLAGGVPYREASAAGLHRRGLAPRVLVSRAHTPDHVQTLIELGIRPHDYLEESRRALLAYGVPAERILVVDEPSRITETELRAVGRFVVAKGYRRVILLTSPEHTRRVRLVWSREGAPSVQALVAGAADRPFPVDDWWRRRRVAETVLHEYLGLLVLVLGVSSYTH
jgi:uncharacterized SAM-binding protein YcdF (DUF218 family)